MASKDYLDTHVSVDWSALKELENALGNANKFRQNAEEDIFNLQKTNLERLANLQVEQINKEKKLKLQAEQEVNEKLIKMGYNAASVVSEKTLEERLKILDKEEKEALKGHRGKVRAKLKAEYDERRKQEEKLEKDKKALTKKQQKKQAKELGQQLSNAVKEAYGDTFSGTGGAAINAIFGGKARKEALKEAGYEGDINKLSKGIALTELTNALSDFAKQLGGTINDIASAQTAIDTRLYGSNNRKWEGSIWKAMSQDVVRYVGMSPIVKQADVVNNLKTMVGQGISFNVEQRALLATVKDGIATTFNALDSSLTKLVRIQQEDTTASRLGMEASLTAFLNNMYETTEYMQSAAADIRGQLYEASALMTAKSATEFEYQVQKWMGSLYSVGFNNTSGLAGALGKLAAGDISAIGNGGYGNLLVMAANKAGLSVAEILSEGLDDSETNSLMEAVVSYLGQIYNETKGSNLLAQQYAGVFGLNASDLKAAANLSNSLGNIRGQNLSNAGMLQNLFNMAGSVWQRTSTGGMMTNLFENLKYATANSMASNPVLYATYMAASMLDDTVGGIGIASPFVMGTGVNIGTTVADMMRAGVMAGGLLGGIGTMLSGLATGNGIGSAALLKNFGVGTGSNVVTRGTGVGLLTSGVTVSESGGYVGNGAGGDVQNKMMTEANDDANAQLAKAKDERNETTLNEVDENVIAIYTLLQEVTDGTKKFHVDLDESMSWTIGENTISGKIF